MPGASTTTIKHIQPAYQVHKHTQLCVSSLMLIETTKAVAFMRDERMHRCRPSLDFKLSNMSTLMKNGNRNYIRIRESIQCNFVRAYNYMNKLRIISPRWEINTKIGFSVSCEQVNRD